MQTGITTQDTDQKEGNGMNTNPNRCGSNKEKKMNNNPKCGNNREKEKKMNAITRTTAVAVLIAAARTKTKTMENLMSAPS